METSHFELTSTESISVRFGSVPLSEELTNFRHRMGAEMMAFMRSLPESTHADAVVFFMQYFQSPFFPKCDFFKIYYSPSWSIIHWLERMGSDRSPFLPIERCHALSAHAMALFLHPLDDHLNDGQLSTTHLSLLLRSQAWLRMNTALQRMAEGVAKGPEIVKGLIEDYYASIGTPPAQSTLDGYCRHFRKQMATWMSVPVLMAMKMKVAEDFSEVLQDAYGGFGIAWRLLDDLQDLDSDMKTGSHSAIYFCLPLEIRLIWDQSPQSEDVRRFKIIRSAVYNDGVWETIKRRIGTELATAASTLDEIQMTGLAEELRCLAWPFRDRPAMS